MLAGFKLKQCFESDTGTTVDTVDKSSDHYKGKKGKAWILDIALLTDG